MGKTELPKGTSFPLSVHHKISKEWPGIEIEAPREAAGD
jgi:hypothetical protein